jgi:hypothetical protein
VSFVALLVIAAALLSTSRLRSGSWDRLLLFGLVIVGGIAAFDAFRLAVREEYRQRYGATVTGVVVSRLTTDREVAARGNAVAYQGQIPNAHLRVDRALARWVRTRSTDVWWVGFEYPSGGTLRRGGDTVSRTEWESLRAGQQVEIRFDPSRQDYERAALAAASDLPDALAQAAIGTALIGLATLLARATKRKRPARRSTATALVTDVTPLTNGRARWRVEFVFLDDEGNKHECVQEFLRDIWQPGHEAIADYEPHRPHEAVLIPVPALMARGPRPLPSPH